MNQKQAEYLVEKIKEILTGHDLVSVHIVGEREPDIRINQEFGDISCYKYSHNDK